jgi:hypothetical protein
VIDQHDAIWSQLVLWRDVNHNGISEKNELIPISQSTVVAIGLNYHWAARRDQYGNIFRYKSLVWLNREGVPTPRPIYDIFFVPVQ